MKIARRACAVGCLAITLLLGSCGGRERENPPGSRGGTSPASPATAPETGTAPAGAGSTHVPETVDPCRMVTRKEARKLLGVEVRTEQTTPQPLTQNNCDYRGVDDYTKSVGVRTFNGRGLQVQPWRQRKERSGWQPLQDIGDAAFARVNTQVSPPVVTVEFVIGDAQGAVTVSGLPAGDLLEAGTRLARRAAKRMDSDESAFAVPGAEAFVGDWVLTSQAVSGPTRNMRRVARVEEGGRMRLTGSVEREGGLTASGKRYRLQDRLGRSSPSGSYRARGDRLTLKGDVKADLRRVPCGEEPKTVRAPYALVRDFVGVLSGRTLTRTVIPQTGGLTRETGRVSDVDPDLIGLWAGEGTYEDGQEAQIFLSAASNGAAAMVFLPHWDIRLKAEDGKFEMSSSSSFGHERGTYRLGGGTQTGTLFTQDGEDTWAWERVDLDHRPPGQPVIQGHCTP